MKIIMFEPFIAVGKFVGGDAKQVLKLSEMLKKEGHEIEFINYRLKGLFLNNIKFIIKFLLTLNKKMGGDVIYASGSPFTGLITSILGKRKKIPTVLNITHLNSFLPFLFESIRIMKTNLMEGGINFFLSNLWNTIRLPILTSPEIIKRKNISKIGLNNISKIIVSCNYVKKNISPLINKNVDIPIIYPGIDIPTKYEKSNTGKNIFYFGALYSGRGIIDLIYSFSSMSKKVTDATLNIFAYPIYEQCTLSLSNFLIKKYNLKSVKLNTNYKPNILDELNKSSVVCLPFRVPPFQPPLTILETMAAAKPVITTDIGSNSEFIQNNETGFLIKVGDIEELTNKISFLLENKHLAKKIGKNARKKIIKKCNWRETGNKIINILETVTKG